MNNEDLRAAISLLRDGMDTETTALVSHHIGSDWLWNIFAQAVFLTGGDEPVFVDGRIEDHGGPTGFIVAITQDSIVRIEFTNPRRAAGSEWVLDVVSERIPITAVTSVAVTEFSTMPNAASWPSRAQLILELDRPATGLTTLTLPADAPAFRERAVRLAELSRILRNPI